MEEKENEISNREIASKSQQTPTLWRQKSDYKLIFKQLINDIKQNKVRINKFR